MERALAEGEFSNIRANPVEQTIRFTNAVTGRYVRFVATHVLDDEPQVAVAEIGCWLPEWLDSAVPSTHLQTNHAMEFPLLRVLPQFIHIALCMIGRGLEPALVWKNPPPCFRRTGRTRTAGSSRRMEPA